MELAGHVFETPVLGAYTLQRKKPSDRNRKPFSDIQILCDKRNGQVLISFTEIVSNTYYSRRTS